VPAVGQFFNRRPWVSFAPAATHRRAGLNAARLAQAPAYFDAIALRFELDGSKLKSYFLIVPAVPDAVFQL
jgi:hypothetical protein